MGHPDKGILFNTKTNDLSQKTWRKLKCVKWANLKWPHCMISTGPQTFLVPLMFGNSNLNALPSCVFYGFKDNVEDILLSIWKCLIFIKEYWSRAYHVLGIIPGPRDFSDAYFMNFTGDCGSVYLELRKKTFTGIYRFDSLCWLRQPPVTTTDHVH